MRAALCLMLAACVVDLRLPDSTIIACEIDDDCPGDELRCQPQTLRCVPKAGYDDVPPALTSATALSELSLLVTFSEPLSADATDLARYTIKPSLAIVGARVNDDGQSVLLETDRQLAGQAYQITATGIRDATGNPMSDAMSAPFVGYGERDTSAPPPIAPLGGVFVRPGTLELRWASRAAASSYLLEIATEPTFTPPLYLSVETTQTSKDVAIAGDGATFYWRVRSNLTDAAAALTVASFDVLQDTAYVDCGDAASCASQPDETGSRAHPYRSVQAALNAASVLGLTRVHVAARPSNKAYREQLKMIDGVTLSGGYTPGTFVHAPAAQKTLIISDSLAVIHATGISSFVVEHLTVDDTGLNPSYSFGFLLDHVTDAVLRNVTVEARLGSIAAVGIGIASSTNVSIEDSTITAGSSSGYQAAQSTGIDALDTTLTLVGNTITTGVASGNATDFGYYRTSGLQLKGVTATIDRNIISAKRAESASCSSTGAPLFDCFCRAVSGEGADLELTFTNNVFVTTNSYEKTAVISLLDGGTASYVNNTFYQYTFSGPRTVSIEQATAPTLLVNNLFVASTGVSGSKNTVYAAPTPVSCTNNVFVDNTCIRSSGASCTDTTGAFCPGSTLLTAAQAQVPISTATAYDVSVNTHATILSGGVDAAPYGVSRDQLGRARSCPIPGSDCYSIGAYELP